MVAKAKPKPATDTPKSTTLRVTEEPGESRELKMARLSLDAVVTNAQTSLTFSKGTFGEIGLTEAVEAMRAKAAKIKAGDLSELEATLTAQAATLDTLFNELAKRAAVNMGQHLGATESYLRLALKAQGQCRSTLETLAEVKYPKAAATFIRQANIAGQQQVNNGQAPDATSTLARAHEKTINPTNELLSDQTNAPLDTAGPGAASRLDSRLEAVGAVDRTEDRSRQASSRQ